MSNTVNHPKVFISYSWSGADHEALVEDIATTLRGNGVDATLDRWHMEPGHDKYAFMERLSQDKSIARVLVICDKKYRDKANARQGGVGVEAQLIAPEVYGKTKQTKFIPLVTEFDEDGEPCLPAFMKGLMYINFATADAYGTGMDELLRRIYEVPAKPMPKLGPPPAFVTDNELSFVRELGAALHAIRNGGTNRHGLELQYVTRLVAELDRLFVQPDGEDADEEVYQAVVATKGLRDQLSEYVGTVAMFSNDDPNLLKPFMKLLDSLGQRMGHQQIGGSAHRPGWYDFYRFFALEALLIQTSALLQFARWDSLRRVMSARYLVRDNHFEQRARSFAAFDSDLEFIDGARRERLKLNRISPSAALLQERCSFERTAFHELAEADIFLALRALVDIGADSSAPASQVEYWMPRTAILSTHRNQHQTFMKAGDEEVRVGLLNALGLTTGPQLLVRLDNARRIVDDFNKLVPNHIYTRFNFLEAVNAKALTKANA